MNRANDFINRLAPENLFFKAHSDGCKFAVNLHAAVAHCCSATKNRKSSIFPHRTCLPHPHASNAHRVNEPFNQKMG